MYAQIQAADRFPLHDCGHHQHTLCLPYKPPVKPTSTIFHCDIYPPYIWQIHRHRPEEGYWFRAPHPLQPHFCVRACSILTFDAFYSTCNSPRSSRARRKFLRRPQGSRRRRTQCCPIPACSSKGAPSHHFDRPVFPSLLPLLFSACLHPGHGHKTPTASILTPAGCMYRCGLDPLRSRS